MNITEFYQCCGEATRGRNPGHHSRWTLFVRPYEGPVLGCGHPSTCAPHEVVKQRHGEGSMPVTRTVDHALRDEGLTDRAQLRGSLAHCRRNIARPIGRAGAKAGHGQQVLLFRLRQPLEA